MERWIAVVLAVLVWAASLGAQEEPPEARRGDHVDVYHGVEVPDPYRWLENVSAPEVERWARGQDAFARSFAAAYPGRGRIGRMIREATEVTRYSPPVRRGGRYFFTTFLNTGGPAPPRSLHVRSTLESGGETRTLIDREALGARGLSLVLATPSPDGRRVAYGVVETGSAAMTLRVLDVASGETLEDELRGLLRGRSSVSWTEGGRGFFYESFAGGTAGEPRTALVEDETLRYHRVGTSQAEDREVFAGPPGEGRSLSHGITRDHRFLVLEVREPETGGDAVHYVDLEDDGLRVRELVAEEGATYSFVGGRGTELWFRTDEDAPRGRVVGIDVTRPEPARWREVVPEAEEAITNWLGATAVGDALVVGYLKDALNLIRVYGLDGSFRYRVELPYPGSLWSGIVGRRGDSEAYYSLSGLVDPGSVYRLDIRTGESALVFAPDASHDPEDFRTEQVFYRAPDGTRIPMFLVRAEGRSAPGPRPVFMYGYAFNWAAAPWYQPHMVAWLRMGGIWALPNTRGGAAYGEAWHRAGAGRKKQTAIDDYVAAARWLIAEGITTPDLVVANTSSAGGPIGGAAVVQHPELFGAAVLDYPILDMLRYDRFTVARSWRSEYGTSRNPEDFRALLGYSPVHNLREGTCYPATLVAPGELDETAPPLHAYKFVASLQHAQGCAAPIALRVSWGAGHASGATPRRSVENWTDQLSFLARVLEDWTPDFGGPPDR